MGSPVVHREIGGTTVLGPAPIGDDMAFALFTDPGGAVVGLLRDDSHAAE
ncbi:hypothetical protein [Nocardia huaxiensis]|uniref:Uncharacterized protein n=1 Tax=Nocardia huaxiensis TaxID=2755382 RepID=A0A7D6ZFB7_9NOCA|nr:hypothetical protein [Nocardia huaxiensis]QLY28580.1 hypothetical protein H0264_24935 [Nocardia huaxiensis]UFS97952.1 hypothetical protein LPY97_08665 [Nocardia huaxiensis]